MRSVLLVCCLMCFCVMARAQDEPLPGERDNDLVQLTGFVVSLDSSKVLPYVSIRINGTKRGSYSDMGGYFSFVMRRGDVLTFSAIGLKPTNFRLPDDFNDSKYTTVIPMADDTFYLPEAVKMAGPTREEFDYYFVKTRIPDDNLSLAYGNLRKPSPMVNTDALEANRWYMQQQSDRYYYMGQSQPIRVFDVFAWQQFLSSLSKKNKKKK